ncbi:MAG: hypothetical protein HY862_21240 [Chloroflexi bacterium]|nr:hypothetical protein [Chloroflexota bacterium]
MTKSKSEPFVMPSIPSVPMPGEPPLKLQVDAEHAGIRLLMPLLAVAGLIVGFMLGHTITRLIDDTLSSVCIGLPSAFIMLVIFTQIGERVIKPKWPSGRSVSLDSNQILFVDKHHQETVFLWANPLDFYAWHFPVVKRRTRVQRGWYCIAVQLQQKEQHITLYTFIDPEKTSAVPHFKDWFIKLRRRREMDDVKTFDPRLAAQITRLHKMENERWLHGGELSNQDFLTLMQLVERHGRYGFGS